MKQKKIFKNLHGEITDKQFEFLKSVGNAWKQVSENESLSAEQRELFQEKLHELADIYRANNYYLPGDENKDRTPDFYNLSVSAGSVVGWSGSITVDRYGSIYCAPLGVGVGKSSTAVSFSITGGWAIDGLKFQYDGNPTPESLINFCSGHSINGGAGVGLGASITYVPFTGTAVNAGIFSPQAGVSYGYSWRLGKNVNGLIGAFEVPIGPNGETIDMMPNF